MIKIVSPSDIGVHNILKNKSNIKFIDFEYAGIDMATKLIFDLLVQPNYLFQRYQIVELFNGLKRYDFFRESLALRVENLLPINVLKWCCIIANNKQFKDPEYHQYIEAYYDKSMSVVSSIQSINQRL